MCIVLICVIRWAYLDINTNAIHSDDDQAYTAGLGEAILTSDLIKLHWHNTLDGYCTLPLSSYCQRLKKFVDTNAAWIQQQLDSKAAVDPYWHQVASSSLSLSPLRYSMIFVYRYRALRNITKGSIHFYTTKRNFLSHLTPKEQDDITLTPV